MKEDNYNNQHPDSITIRDYIISVLDKNKAEDIVTIDLAGKSNIADFMIIATGNVGRHTIALAEHVLKGLKQDFNIILTAQGIRNGNWVLIDTGDIMVHIFRPEFRELYALEKMWSVRSESND